MASRRIIDDQRYVQFVTFSVDRRRRLLDHEHPKRILLGVLNEELVNFESRCVGFVLMPDHVHSLIWLSHVGQLSRFMHAWKRKSAFHILKWYRTQSPKYLTQQPVDRFWQPKYHAFAIYEQAKLREKLQYIHMNPVRARLVEKPTDWKWSSARWYEQRMSVGVPIRWID